MHARTLTRLAHSMSLGIIKEGIYTQVPDSKRTTRGTHGYYPPTQEETEKYGLPEIQELGHGVLHVLTHVCMLAL